jgi:hypothetical protein
MSGVYELHITLSTRSFPMGLAFPLFGAIEEYNPANPQHYRTLCVAIQGRVFRIWFRQPTATLVEAMPLFDKLVGWFRAARFDDFIPLADFESAVMNAIRNELEGDKTFCSSCQQHFGKD